MAQVIPFNDPAATLERERKAFRLRLAGGSVRAIAEELGCSPDEVESALARSLGAVTPGMRQRAIQIELERLDAMQKAHYDKACSGDIDSTAMSLKIMELRAKILGLMAPQRSDDLLGRALADKHENTTDRIRRALDLIVSGKEIDGEVVKEDG